MIVSQFRKGDFILAIAVKNPAEDSMIICNSKILFQRIKCRWEANKIVDDFPHSLERPPIAVCNCFSLIQFEDLDCLGTFVVLLIRCDESGCEIASRRIEGKMIPRLVDSRVNQKGSPVLQRKPVTFVPPTV